MINGYGPAFGYLGYQVHARQFFSALDRLEPVALSSTNARAADFAASSQLNAMLERGACSHRNDPSIAIDYGNNFHRFAGDWRIGYTVFEYTRLPADWHHGLRQVDEVWTTSSWGREVLLLNGLDPARIAVVPEGFDPEVFHAGLKSRRSRDGTFRFLCVGKWEVRKGQSELLRAWARAFPPEAPVELVLLCDNPFVKGFDPQAEIARLALGRTAPIRVARPAPTDREMAQIYADADCFVLPTRAEGWGLPIMEAMACGTPVITTRYSAMTDYANDDNAYLLEVKRLVPVHDPLFFPQAGERGLWAEIDPDQLVTLLRQVVDQRDAAAARGARAATDMLRAWTWDHAARVAWARLRRVEPIAAPRRPPQRGIAEWSLHELLGEVDRAQAAGGPDAAIDLYGQWLLNTPVPGKFVAQFNRAHLLAQQNRLAEAEAEYRAALAGHPDFIQAGLNLGSVLERSGRADEALSLWQETLVRAEAVSDPDSSLRIHALNNLGRVFEQRHRYADAEAALARSLALKPDQDDVLHHWVHLRQKQCEWPVFSPLPGIDVSTMRRAASALAMLSASGDPAEQLDTARRYALAKIPQDLPPLAPAGGYRHQRLRIGYLSSNLNLHAVTILTAEVYELHDRGRVEVFGFCWSPEDGTPMRARVRRALDHLVRIDAMGDAEAAQAIRAAEIDVLIDLQGLTSGCRPVILAHRPAPVQVSWLGFPGTSAIPGVDYILADRYLIPEAERGHYSETPLYLPECFQPNDRQRAIAPTPTRAGCGLPEAALVLCAFNHNHKFNPELFGVWMEILAGLPQAVLWLLADNEPARANLAAFAVDHGIAGERLIFAPRVMPTEYLARFRVADLFLDTLPFNGGTTASDALWAGLPVLTCSGRTFAGRMAGSLLHAAGLPELVTHSLADYRDLALALGRDPARLAALRERLAANRSTCPLFDTPRLVKALEDALCQVAHHPPA